MIQRWILRMQVRRAEASAAEWLIESEDDRSPEFQRRFAQWRSASPLNEAAVQKLGRTHSVLLAAGEAAAANPAPLPSRPRHSVRELAVASGIAAAAVVSIGAWSLFVAGNGAIALPPTEYSTVGEQYARVELPDGSVMELNADSLAKVEFLEGRRRVELQRGEAHFEVARDETHPFVVEVDNVQVSVLGTDFNVQYDSGQVQVLVAHGRVRVEPRPTAPNPPAPDLSGQDGAPVLTAGEMVIVKTEQAVFAPKVERVDAVKLKDMLAWQGLRLVFENTPLADAVRRFNEHNAVKIRLADPSLGRIPIGGAFRADNPAAFARLLGANPAIDVETATDGTIVLHSAKR